MNLKKWKGIYEKICWERVLVLRKKNLPGRGLTKVEKHWCKERRGVLGTKQNLEDNSNILFSKEVLRLVNNSSFLRIDHTDD